MLRMALPLFSLLFLLISSSVIVAAPPGRSVIVVLKEDVDSELAASDAASRGATVTAVYHYALRAYAAELGPAELAALAADPRVDFVSENRPVWTDGTLAAPATPAQILPTGVRHIEADRSSRFA